MDDVSILRQKLQDLKIENILKELSLNYNSQIIFSTSLSAEDQIILNEIYKSGIEVKIITLDTGRLFPETYDLIQINVSKYKLPIKFFFPNNDEVEEMVNTFGINLFYDSIENRKKCCNIRKVMPLTRALEGNKIWINGLRREQSTTRNQLEIVEKDKNFNIIKVNPLYNWTEEMVWKYIKENNVPYNNLHNNNYPSIGCQPCTRAIEKGEDLRAGRWWWENPESKECGLHKTK